MREREKAIREFAVAEGRREGGADPHPRRGKRGGRH